MTKEKRKLYGISQLKQQGKTYQEIGIHINAMKRRLATELSKEEPKELVSTTKPKTKIKPQHWWKRLLVFVKKLFKQLLGGQNARLRYSQDGERS